ncbi:hypothetical protein [Pediococcus parvulus]|uniref:hypothetical protein n=1 Tax=Pediococcus parvulus TaxID=54062 RepID=UPI000B242C88|nr:hypothetical protein [Pediococcus parvulus]
MKAWVIKSSKFTEIDQLQLLEVARPQPHEKELLVRVHDVGLNPVDYKLVNRTSAWQLALPPYFGFRCRG